MRIALYARVSKKTGTQDAENQLAQLRAFVGIQGWTIAHEYVDRATGKHSDREQFQKMFEDASRRTFDLVLFWSLDRFSREGVLETLDHLQRLAAHRVGYRSSRSSTWILRRFQGCGARDPGHDRKAGAGQAERADDRRAGAGPRPGAVGGRPRVVLDRSGWRRWTKRAATTREIGEEMGIPRRASAEF